MNILEELTMLDEMLQIRLIFMLIIFVAVFAILKQMTFFSLDKKVKLVISILIAVIAARSMSSSMIEKIGLSSKFLGLFVIYLGLMLAIIFFLHKKNTTSLVRKFILSLFAAALVYSIYIQYEYLSEKVKIIAGILCGITLLLIFFDSHIHKWARYKSP